MPEVSTFSGKGSHSPAEFLGWTQHTGSHLSLWFLDWSHSTPVCATELVPWYFPWRWHFPWQVVRVNLRQPGKWYVETQPVLTLCAGDSDLVDLQSPQF